jgi:hypothetical protein
MKTKVAHSAIPGDDTDTDTLTQSNANATQQVALAYNLDSPDAVTTASNSATTDQSNQIGTQLPGTPPDIFQSNSNETVQIAIAVNDHSAGAQAIASNFNFTEQVNLIGLLGTDALEMDDGSIARINANTTLQFDLAINFDSPDALAEATSTNTTIQANLGGSGYASGSNQTVQIGLGLDIDSPNALAIAIGRNTTVQIGGGHGGVMSDISLSYADLPGGGCNYNSVGESRVAAQILAGIGGLSFLPSADAAQIMAVLRA